MLLTLILSVIIPLKIRPCEQVLFRFSQCRPCLRRDRRCGHNDDADNDDDESIDLSMWFVAQEGEYTVSYTHLTLPTSDLV